MNESAKTSKIWNGITGIGGVVLLACTACCIPLLAPLLAWVGVAALGLMHPIGWIVAIALVVIAGGLHWLRRRSQCHAPGTGRCGVACGETGERAADDQLD